MARVTTQITCDDFFPARDEALRAHAADRPEQGVLRGAHRMAATAVADGGVQAGQDPRPDLDPRDRSIRRNRDP